MPATKGFGNESKISVAPANNFTAITPHDTNELTYFTRAIYVGVGGDLVVIGSADTVAVTFVDVTAGSVIPISVKIVKATGTTATSLVALY